jgi:hypothetical protein
MMKKSLIVLLAVLVLAGSNAFAQSFDGGKQVNHIYKDSGQTYIKVEDTMINPAACFSDYWYAIPVSDPAHDDYLSMAMTAMASGKTLSIYISDTACQASGHPTVIGIISNR